MPEIILITLAKNLFRILKNEVRNQKKNRKGGCTLPINPSPIKNQNSSHYDLHRLKKCIYRANFSINELVDS